jgi:hypothetical protein
MCVNYSRGLSVYVLLLKFITRTHPSIRHIFLQHVSLQHTHENMKEMQMLQVEHFAP